MPVALSKLATECSAALSHCLLAAGKLAASCFTTTPEPARQSLVPIVRCFGRDDAVAVFDPGKAPRFPKSACRIGCIAKDKGVKNSLTGWDRVESFSDAEQM
jgi:hypothetical protein